MKKIILMVFFILFLIEPVYSEEKGYIKIISPQDKTVLSKNTVSIEGTISSEGQIDINGENIVVKNKKFSKIIPLDPGKNLIEITYKGYKNITEKKSIRILKMESMLDIKDTFWAKKAVQAIATLGILSKGSDGYFKPDQQINKTAITAALIKAKGIQVETALSEDVYSDVKKDYWGAPYIKAARDMGLIGADSNGKFNPQRVISKAEGISILLDFAGYKALDKVDAAPYPDVPKNHKFAGAISKAKEVKLLDETKSFMPDKPLTKAYFASVIYKLAYIKEKISDLYNWDTYTRGNVKINKGINRAPQIKGVLARPDKLKADGVATAKIIVEVTDPDGKGDISYVEMDLKYLGWPHDAKINLYDDGINNGDEVKNDGLYTGEIMVFPGVSQGSKSILVKVVDLKGLQNVKEAKVQVIK